MNKIFELNYQERGGTHSIGTLDLGETVDITDPCYGSTVWCRLNGIRIVPGTYEGRVKLKDEGEWGVRVARLGIYKSTEVCKAARTKSWVAVGDIGVDAGLTGIFSHKEDFTDEQWGEFVNNIYSGQAWAFDDPVVKGFCSSSGYGDGCYDVIGHPSAENPEAFDGIEIRFL